MKGIWANSDTGQKLPSKTYKVSTFCERKKGFCKSYLPGDELFQGNCLLQLFKSYSGY